MPESNRAGALAAVARAGGLRLVEPWFAPFALVNGAALGLTRSSCRWRPAAKASGTSAS